MNLSSSGLFVVVIVGRLVITDSILLVITGLVQDVYFFLLQSWEVVCFQEFIHFLLIFCFMCIDVFIVVSDDFKKIFWAGRSGSRL